MGWGLAAGRPPGAPTTKRPCSSSCPTLVDARPVLAACRPLDTRALTPRALLSPQGSRVCVRDTRQGHTQTTSDHLGAGCLELELASTGLGTLEMSPQARGLFVGARAPA